MAIGYELANSSVSPVRRSTKQATENLMDTYSQGCPRRGGRMGTPSGLKGSTPKQQTGAAYVTRSARTIEA